MESRLTLVTLGVADLARARAFYEAIGFEVAAAQGDFVVLKGGGVGLGLYPRDELAKDVGVSPEGAGFRGVAIGYCTRSKQEVAPALEAAKRAGGRIVKPAQDVFWGGHSGYFADLDGHLWEVAWNPYLELTEEGFPKFGG